MDDRTEDEVAESAPGSYVLARKIEDIPDDSPYKGPNALPLNLYYDVGSSKYAPLWIEGFWDDSGMCWITPFGDIGEPLAWAPLPKTPEDWS